MPFDKNNFLSTTKLNTINHSVDMYRIYTVDKGVHIDERMGHNDPWFWHLITRRTYLPSTFNISNCLNIVKVVSMIKTNCKFYSHACLVYQFILTLPITVSSNERSFSKLKLIKTYLRSTMNSNRLFYLLISSIECDLLHSIVDQ